MSDTAIRIVDLGKQYRIGSPRQRYKTFRDTLVEVVAAPVRRAYTLARGMRPPERQHTTIWALKDVSLEVRRGDVIGVIGRNGAGKSTLLKVLSRITEPSTGYADIYGRVGSLLEVGTGFHHELTGRENVYLNGAILGMRRVEIDRHFDAMIAFAEVEKFVDTPVKHYSTGMYLRLAFAVAAHLEPHILLVDEVLAVGDAVFQKKCLGKMGEVAREGRTVLFVSHNMAAIRTLCSRSIVLDGGQLAYVGDTASAIHHYAGSLANAEEPRAGRRVDFTNVRVHGGAGEAVECGRPFGISSRLHIQDPLPSFNLYCIIQDCEGEIVVHATISSGEMNGPSAAGTYEVEVSVPALWLKPGVYNVHFKLMGNTLGVGKLRFVSDSVMLDVSGMVRPEMLLGYLTPRVDWAVEGPDLRFHS